MKTMILLVALAMALPAWGQAPAKPAVQSSQPAAKPATAKAAKKSSARRHQDARHCLQRGDNDAIIKCAEEYL